MPKVTENTEETKPWPRTRRFEVEEAALADTHPDSLASQLQLMFADTCFQDDDESTDNRKREGQLAKNAAALVKAVGIAVSHHGVPGEVCESDALTEEQTVSALLAIARYLETGAHLLERIRAAQMDAKVGAQ